MCLVVCALIESARTDGLLMAVSAHDPFSTTPPVSVNKFATKQSDIRQFDSKTTSLPPDPTYLGVRSVFRGESYVLRSKGSVSGTLPVGSAPKRFPGPRRTGTSVRSAPDGTDDRPYRRDDRAGRAERASEGDPEREDARGNRGGREGDPGEGDDFQESRREDPEGEDSEGEGDREDRREDDRREGEGREDRREDRTPPYRTDPGADRASAYGREASEVGREVERGRRRDGEGRTDPREAPNRRPRGSLREGLPRREADPGRALRREGGRPIVPLPEP
jgi:hypothetical protein